MARYYKIWALSIILIVILHDSVAFKGKKDYKKTKDAKNKGKFVDVSVEDVKTRPGKHYAQHQQHSHRHTRSVKEAKVRAAFEEPTDEKIQYTHSKGRNSQKPQVDDSIISRRYENTCGKKFECGVSEKRKQKVSHLASDDTVGNGKTPIEKKGTKVNKMKRIYLERAETEEEVMPEDVEYGFRHKRAQRERKIPAFLVFEDSAVDFLNGEQDTRYHSKSGRHLPPKFIIDSENEIDLENATGHHYTSSSEDPIEEAVSYPGLNDTEEDYEEDFL